MLQMLPDVHWRGGEVKSPPPAETRGVRLHPGSGRGKAASLGLPALPLPSVATPAAPLRRKGMSERFFSPEVTQQLADWLWPPPDLVVAWKSFAFSTQK